MSLFPAFPDGIVIVCLKGKKKVEDLILKNVYRECIAIIIKPSDKTIIL